MSKVTLCTIMVLAGAIVHGFNALTGEAAWERYAEGVFWITATLLTIHFAGERR